MVCINDGLSVLGVMERSVGGLNDPRIRVGEVPLSLRAHDRILRRVVTVLRSGVVVIALVRALFSASFRARTAASASNAARASASLTRRDSRRASSGGNSSPRWSFPCDTKPARLAKSWTIP